MRVHLWQHDETGRMCWREDSPGSGWNRVGTPDLVLAQHYDALRAEVERLNRMRVHCEHCGADYAQTGLEAGCPCKLRADAERFCWWFSAETPEMMRAINYHKDCTVELPRLDLWRAAIDAARREGE
jgi:hypothetical protein